MMLWDNARSAFVCQNAGCGRLDIVEGPIRVRMRRRTGRV